MRRAAQRAQQDRELQLRELERELHQQFREQWEEELTGTVELDDPDDDR